MLKRRARYYRKLPRARKAYAGGSRGGSGGGGQDAAAPSARCLLLCRRRHTDCVDIEYAVKAYEQVVQAERAVVPPYNPVALQRCAFFIEVISVRRD